mgnify:CR=1 FL=1
MEPEKGIERRKAWREVKAKARWNPRKGLKADMEHTRSDVVFLREWNPRKGLKATIGLPMPTRARSFCGTRERD